MEVSADGAMLLVMESGAEATGASATSSLTSPRQQHLASWNRRTSNISPFISSHEAVSERRSTMEVSQLKTAQFILRQLLTR